MVTIDYDFLGNCRLYLCLPYKLRLLGHNYRLYTFLFPTPGFFVFALSSPFLPLISSLQPLIVVTTLIPCNVSFLLFFMLFFIFFVLS